ncbi:MAG: hypothetical protein H9W81_13585 [Enterococcus sp.]|nr:hypothetical protein [Enterococcus sp.]
MRQLEPALSVLYSNRDRYRNEAERCHGYGPGWETLIDEYMMFSLVFSRMITRIFKLSETESNPKTILESTIAYSAESEDAMKEECLHIDPHTITGAYNLVRGKLHVQMNRLA